MRWLDKDPLSIRSPSGIEWRLWKLLPRVLWVGTLLPGAWAAWLWWTAPQVPGGAQDPAVLHTVYVLAGVVVLHWTVVLTVAIGCGIVMLMKGPRYLADSYEMNDKDTL